MLKDFTSDIADQGGLNFSSLNTASIQVTGDSVALPNDTFIRDADMSRDGFDLVLKGPDGEVTIENYFAAEPTPNLVGPSGVTLTPELVESFSQEPLQFADNSAGVMADSSPVGAVQELSGEATVTRLDGTVETVQIGTPIFQGDVVETNGDGAVNILFVDETSFAISEDARLAIDEYVFDPATMEGSTNFSVLKGVFVFTSGLIGREDPDDVNIDTPVGSIGIRGTIIAGDVTNAEITVVEGAIVVKDFSGNEMTLSNQFETAKIDLASGNIQNMGQLSAADVAGKFSAVSGVSPQLFSSINDAANETNQNNNQNSANDAADEQASQENEPKSSADEAAGENAPDDVPAEKADENGELGDETQEDAKGDSDEVLEQPGDNETKPEAAGSEDANNSAEQQPTQEANLEPVGSPDGAQTQQLAEPTSPEPQNFGDSGFETKSHTKTTNEVKKEIQKQRAAEKKAADLANDDLGTEDLRPVDTFDTVEPPPEAIEKINDTVNDDVVTPTRTTDIDLTALDGSNGFTITDDIAQSFGDSFAVTSDGDKYDLIIGRDGSQNLTFSLNGYLGSGSETLPGILVGSPSFNDTGYSAPIVTSVGDINADGIDDYAVSYDSTNRVSFRNGADDTELFHLTGQGGSKFGSSVSGIGDVNGDGYDDVIIGAPAAFGNHGASYIVYGDDNLSLSGQTGNIEFLSNAKSYNSATGNLGANATDSFTDGSFVYTLDGSDIVSQKILPDGSLGPQSGTTSILSGTTHVHYDHALDRVAMINGSTLEVYSVDSLTGMLTSVDIDTTNLSGALDVTTIGNYAYVMSTFDGGSNFNNIEVYDISGASISHASQHTGLFTAGTTNLLHSVNGDLFLFTDNSGGGNESLKKLTVNPGTGAITGSNDVVYSTNQDLDNTLDIAFDDNSTDAYALVDNGGTTEIWKVDLTGTGSITDVPTKVAAEASAPLTVPALDNATDIVFDAATFTLAAVTSSGDVVSFHINPGDGSLMHTGTKNIPNLGSNPQIDFVNGEIVVTGDDESVTIVQSGVILGNTNTANNGETVSGIGDFDGDGYSDFVTTSPGDGTAKLVLGQSGLLTPGSDKITFTNLNVGVDNEIPVINIGDIDGDGHDDLVLASTGSNGGNGVAHVFFGGSIAANSTIDVTDNNSYNGTNGSGFRIHTGTMSIISAGAAGDFNGDGHDDVVIALKNPGASEKDVEIYVVFGGTTITDGNVITLNELQNDTDDTFFIQYTITTNGNADNFDFEFSNADLNGDGFDDLIIGTPDEDNSVTNSDGSGGTNDDSDGSVHVVYGQESGPYVGDYEYGGLADGNSDILMGTSGSDVLNGFAFIDLTFNAGEGNDTLRINTTNYDQHIKIDGGLGFDTLKFTGTAASTIDFANIQNLTGIERFDFVNTQNDAITLTLADIIQNGSDNHITSLASLGTLYDTGDVSLADFGGNVTKIRKDVGDTVDLSTNTGDFKHIGYIDLTADTETADDYQIYVNSTQTEILLINNDIGGVTTTV